MNILESPQTLAGLSVLSYVAELAAKYKLTLWTTIRAPEVQPLAADTVRLAFLRAGAPEAFDPEKVIFLSSAQFAYASGVVGLLHRERVAANVMVGGFWAESLIFAEAGHTIGAIQVAGTANTHQLPFFVAACDYCMIGEEIYAAGAYITKEPVQVGAIWGQDYGKLIVIVLIVIGMIMAAMGNPAFVKWLTGPLW
ncbi:MAG: hypothetical protein AOA65_0876 [Candidatus Bathyarchaeota archaeon BA1]|nr:MAG: hypothetical protein AOA65_0876 [Candidatus Bathyarchaeota archaeon BA1]